MVYQIVENYGGSIELDGNAGGGTRVILRFPNPEPQRDERAIS
jgi:signal transduction histidine kinase